MPAGVLVLVRRLGCVRRTKRLVSLFGATKMPPELVSGSLMTQPVTRDAQQHRTSSWRARSTAAASTRRDIAGIDGKIGGKEHISKNKGCHLAGSSVLEPSGYSGFSCSLRRRQRRWDQFKCRGRRRLTSPLDRDTQMCRVLNLSGFVSKR